MSQTKGNLVHSGGFFNTLAQGGTRTTDKYNFEPVHLLRGEGTSQSSMKKRPTKKLITQSLVLALVDIAKEEGNKRMEDKYWNTYHCFNRIKTDGKKAFGSYCKNRICLICCANRKAKLINTYFPIIKKWNNPCFLTLTRKSFTRTQLKEGIKQTKKSLQTIIKKCQKRHIRKGGPDNPKIVCLVTLECNYNPIAKTYNPHFHIITESLKIAHNLNVEWLRHHTKTETNCEGQKIKIIKKNEKENTLIEVVKYSTKIFTDPDMKKGKNKIKHPKIYAAAIHEIVKAFEGVRLLSTYGFQLPKIEKGVKKQEKADHDVKTWSYIPKHRNYIEDSTGEVMLIDRHMPEAEVEYLVKHRLDNESF